MPLMIVNILNVWQMHEWNNGIELTDISVFTAVQGTAEMNKNVYDMIIII